MNEGQATLPMVPRGQAYIDLVRAERNKAPERADSQVVEKIQNIMLTMHALSAATAIPIADLHRQNPQPTDETARSLKILVGSASTVFLGNHVEEALRYLGKYIPKSKEPDGKFTPFDDETKAKLNALYERCGEVLKRCKTIDFEAIKELENVGKDFVDSVEAFRTAYETYRTVGADGVLPYTRVSARAV